MPLYAALMFGAALTLGCMTAWFGEALIWILMVGVGLAALGGFHYWAWGRGMQPPEDV